MDALPPELVREILESLDQDDLRHAAAVSRAFYAWAWRAGLVIHRNILWEQKKSCSEQLETWSDIVQHALGKNLRLSLSLTLRPDGPSDSHDDSSSSETPYADVLSLIPNALPILVDLAATVSGPMIPRLAAVLEHPAPNLRSLSLTVQPNDGTQPPTRRFEVFGGIAPQLRQLTLQDIRVGPDPVAAWAHVCSLSLQYTTVMPEMMIARHFPALRTLTLVFFTTLPAPPPVVLDLHGVRLENLSITESDPPTLLPAILRTNDLVDVPAFDYVCSSAPWTEPLWERTKDDGLLCVRLMGYSSSDSDVSIVLVPEHRRWYREYDVNEWYPDWPFPLADVPQLAERLVYLRMENIYLVGFLECKDVAFRALREIQVDFWAELAHSSMVWPPDWIDAFEDCTFEFDAEDGAAPTFEKESYSYVECPALDTIRLFSVDQEILVASEEVAFLGRALRRKEGRAALELHGLQLHEPVAQALLKETFSAVRQYEFAGWDCPVGRDSGLWDIRTSDS